MTQQQIENKPKRGYWYFITYEECVLCGAHHEYRGRVYDRPKPTRPEDRHRFVQYACGHHSCEF